MDEIDRRIVDELRRDARISNRALAERVGLAPSSTLSRVRSLEARGCITGYRAEVDPASLGRPLEALVFVRIRPKTDHSVRHFVQRAWAIDRVVAVYLISGGDDAVVHVAVEDSEALRATVLAEIGLIEGVVDERTSLVFEHRQR